MDDFQLSEKELQALFELDPEVIDIETSEAGSVFPVVRAYDDMEVHLRFWCNHCRTWHLHGRGGRDAAYQEGRSGNAGHRTSHCTCENSPFDVHGYILHVVGKFSPEIKKLCRNGATLYCPKCRNRYSAAFNACGCGLFVNKTRVSKHPSLASKYQEIMAQKVSARRDQRYI